MLKLIVIATVLVCSVAHAQILIWWNYSQWERLPPDAKVAYIWQERSTRWSGWQTAAIRGGAGPSMMKNTATLLCSRGCLRSTSSRGDLAIREGRNGQNRVSHRGYWCCGARHSRRRGSHDGGSRRHDAHGQAVTELTSLIQPPRGRKKPHPNRTKPHST